MKEKDDWKLGLKIIRNENKIDPKLAAKYARSSALGKKKAGKFIKI